MHQHPNPVGMRAEWRNNSDASAIALLNHQPSHLDDHCFRFRPVESAASAGPYNLALNIHPLHGRAGCPRSLQCFVIRRNPEPAPIKVPIRERNDVAVRPVMIAQVHDIFVAAQATGQIEQRVHRIGPRRATFRQSVSRQQQAILLRRYGADMLQL